MGSVCSIEKGHPNQRLSLLVFCRWGNPAKVRSWRKSLAVGELGREPKLLGSRAPHCDHRIILLFPQLARGFEAIIIDLSTGAGGMGKLGGLMAVECIKQGR